MFGEGFELLLLFEAQPALGILRFALFWRRDALCLPGLLLVGLGFKGLQSRGVSHHAPTLFKVEHGRADPIDQRAVMADYEARTIEGDQGFFEHPQGHEVQIVGRFIKQDHVGPLKHHLGEEQAHSLATREVVDPLLKLLAAEEEAA